MNKLGKIKLSHVYIGGISLIILVLVFSLGILSTFSVESLGSYAAKVTSSNINESTSTLATEYTEALAARYTSLFRTVKQAVYIIAKTTEYFLDGQDYTTNQTSTLLASKTLSLYKNYFTNTPGSSVSICYWGDEKTIPLETRAAIDRLTYLPILISHIKDMNPAYYEVWMENLRDSYFICSPDIHQLYNSISRNTFFEYCKDEYRHEISRHQLGRPDTDFMWTTPQFEIGDKSKLTFNIEYPIFSSSHELLGFAGIDIDIEKMLSGYNISIPGNNDYFRNIFNKTFLLNETGTIIEFPPDLYESFGIKQPLIAKDSKTGVKYIDINPKLPESTNRNVKELYRLFSTKSSGVRYIDLDNGKNYMITFARIKTNNWITGVIIPSEYLYRSIHMTNDKMQYLKLGLAANYIALSLIFFFAAIILSVVFFRYLIIKPINKIQDVVKQLGTGKFDVSFDKIETAEFSSLMKGIQKLGKDLTIYTDNLKKEIKTRQAMETELDIAAQVQTSILPRITDSFIREEFELYARLEPARYIGGDFYDFFYINDDLLVLVIADISGKGISAATYMGMAKSTIKNVCFRDDLELDPGKILFKVNNHFARDNDVGMFVTSQIIFYNVSTGDITFSSAGHHDMLRMNTSGDITPLGLGSTVLGLFKDSIYPVKKDKLRVGDTLIMYTDGITEAINPAKVFFGETRLQEALKKFHDRNVRETVDGIISEVITYEEGERFDDVTVLAIRRKE